MIRGLQLIALAVVVYFLVTEPQQAAAAVQSIVGSLGDAGEEIAEFVGSL